ncbi:hypothetical protein [Xanthomonas tesorieronis]|uniref:hypothetical protein n=1 Tax=Xanthomonas tesorieronis TaxID=3160839 RepID=UPI0035192CBE
MKPRLVATQIAGLLFLASACGTSAAAKKTPMASDVLAVPADVPTRVLFTCAQDTIARFSDTSSSWPKVTRNDAAAGVLESGDFPKKNRSGFRMRIERPRGAVQAKITLKGAGAYFADLGVDQALADLKSELDTCIASQPL